MPDQSPYFQKTPNRRRSDHDTSAYFRQSPSSAYGAVQALGPVLFCLSTSFPQPEKCTKQRNDCSECQPWSRAALSHFGGCPLFLANWNYLRNEEDTTACGDGETTKLPCWRQTEKRLHQSVRHLCSHRCFMRAYAPHRAWFALCQAIQRGSCPDESVSSAVKGWRCVLEKELLPRVSFVSPCGGVFSHQSAALRRILHVSQRGIDNEGCDGSDVISNEAARKRRVLFRDARPTEKWKTDSELLQPAVVSKTPFGLLEELFVDDPWQLLISTIMLNRTTRLQVDSVLCTFLRRWPTPHAVLAAEVENLVDTLRPLGMCQRRAVGIQRFSKEYLELAARKMQQDPSADERCFSMEDVMNLYYCGEYASAAYKIFIQGDCSEDPCDHALKAYAAYHRGLLVG